MAQETKQNELQQKEPKQCSLCAIILTDPTTYETFPLTFEPPDQFPKRSNWIFCSKTCVVWYLMNYCDSYLQTLYSLYCLTTSECCMNVTQTSNPAIMSCRQISSSCYPKQCSVCFQWCLETPPVTYVTGYQYGKYNLADMAFCSRPCVKWYVKCKMEPYFFQLLQEYWSVVNGLTHVGLAPHPQRLKSRQIVEESDSLTLEEYHKQAKLEESGLPADQYYTVYIHK